MLELKTMYATNEDVHLFNPTSFQACQIDLIKRDFMKGHNIYPMVLLDFNIWYRLHMFHLGRVYEMNKGQKGHLV